MKVKNIVSIDQEKCISCGKCIEMCPKKILYLDPVSKKCDVTDDSLCDRSAGCQRVCPTQAIKIN